MKLILIDDDCLVVSALKMILESQPGFEVAASAFDGSEALSLYRKHRPDVLLMDIRMKGMDGLKASEQILKEFPVARILLLTTFSDDEYIIKSSPVSPDSSQRTRNLPLIRRRTGSASGNWT